MVGRHPANHCATESTISLYLFIACAGYNTDDSDETASASRMAITVSWSVARPWDDRGY
ncbi:hypothetical protein CBM2589_U20014 [Cupriavidus taiwanensis]|uniref:Uncharacterized protein n=1 Tax=Cupriavidus taiwanensis TaxID=164546 RepID=A0A375CS22_9BURK|nr:hypothetical protein CBM2589_U20014 [Cupriavidus taiwanensis]